jgi:hypothetical protein
MSKRSPRLVRALVIGAGGVVQSMVRSALPLLEGTPEFHYTLAGISATLILIGTGMVAGIFIYVVETRYAERERQQRRTRYDDGYEDGYKEGYDTCTTDLAKGGK